jgi:hypothetical protein
MLRTNPKVNLLFERHADWFFKMGLEPSDILYLPKQILPYKDTAYITFYEKELELGKDIYVEFVDEKFEPLSKTNKLWLWVYNKYYKEECLKTDPHPITGHICYMVPISELVEMEPLHKDQSVKSVKKEEEVPMSQMTLRDYAAIYLKVPLSNREWLNEMIKQSKT